MRFIKRAALGAALAFACAGAGASTAQAETGCVGFPDIGGAAYHCFTINADDGLPRVTTTGTTTVGNTVPAFCYFLDCTDATPVYYTAPVRLKVSRPTTDVTIFEWQNSCNEVNGVRTCSSTTRIWYDAPSSSCVFSTDHPSFAALNGQRVTCQV